MRPSCGESSCRVAGRQNQATEDRALFVQVNGESRQVADGISLSDLVADLALAPERIAIECNRQVVRRGEWSETTLADGDRIEIVHFVGGGAEID